MADVRSCKTHLSTIIASLLAALIFACQVRAAGAQANGPSSPPPAIGSSGTSGGNSDGHSPAAPLEPAGDSTKQGDRGQLPSQETLTGAFGGDVDQSVSYNPSAGVEGGDQPGYNANTQNTAVVNPVVFKDAMSGVSDVMKENAWRNIHTNLLSSPGAILNITWQLTEPGVAQGYQAAFQQSAWVNQLTYDGERSLMEQYKLGGTQGFSSAMSMLNCERQVMADQKKKGENESWQKASMACEGALDTSAATTTDSTEAKTDGSTHSAVNNPAAKPVDCEKLVQNPDAKSVLDESGLSADEKDKFRANYGDIKYAFIEDPENPDKPKDASKKQRSGTTVTCPVPPTNPAWKQAQDSEKDYWRSILLLLEERCKTGVREASRSDTYTPFDPAQRTSFWSNSNEWVAKFSMPGFSFKATNIDIIYNLFIAKELKELTEESCHERLSPDVDRNNLDKLKKGEVKTRVEHRSIHFLTQWIVLGKEFENARTEFNRLWESYKTVSIPNDPNGQRFGAIANLVAAGLHVNGPAELEQRRQQNLVQLNAFQDRLQEYGSQVTGKSQMGWQSIFDKADGAPDPGAGYGGH